MRLIGFMRELPADQICERKLEVYLQNYLNEFCYKFNQRYFGNALFDWLKATALAYKKDYRYNIASSFFYYLEMRASHAGYASRIRCGAVVYQLYPPRRSWPISAREAFLMPSRSQKNGLPVSRS